MVQSRRALVDEASVALRRLVAGLQQAIREDYARSSLTISQATLLRMLLEEDAMTPRGLSHDLHVTPATITGLLNKMEEAGFVERTRDTKDRRVVSVRATRRGRQLAQRASSAACGRLERFLQNTTDADLRNFVSVLRTAVAQAAAPGA